LFLALWSLSGTRRAGVHTATALYVIFGSFEDRYLHKLLGDLNPALSLFERVMPVLGHLSNTLDRLEGCLRPTHDGANSSAAHFMAALSSH
jgi:hypothetical protein